jgi:kynurenine formamidase
MGFIPGRVNPVLTPFTYADGMGDAADTRLWHDDAIQMGTQACTHWDGLAHASYGGCLYNGYPDTSITELGATLLGIHHVRTLVSRGVLLDVASARSVGRLDGGHALTSDDLDAAVELAATRIEPGDVVLIRTGHIQRYFEGDRMGYAATAPGPGLGTVEWFHRHQVAAVAIDNLIFEVFPSESTDVPLPVHFIHLVDMGLTQGQNWDLEELAADCRSDGRYTFLLSASPEPVKNGAGAPVNPVAIK